MNIKLQTCLLPFLLVALSMSIQTSSGQDATVFGTVKDSVGKPLYGVGVSVYGKPIGTTTDEKGNYSLSVPANQNLKIIFSFTGLNRDSAIVDLKEKEKLE